MAIIGARADFEFEIGDIKYRYFSSAQKMYVTGLSSAGASATGIIIPGYVRYNNTDYRVYGINSEAFYKKTKLKLVMCYFGLEEVGEGAFKGCSKLVAVRLPSSLKRIGSLAFNQCSSLTTLGFAGEKPPTVGSNAFLNINKNCKLATSTLDALEAYYDDANYNVFSSKTRDPAFAYDFLTDNTYFIITSNPDAINGKVKIVGVPPNTTTLTIKQSAKDNTHRSYGNLLSDKYYSVSEIAERAFSNNTTLTSVAIDGDYGSALRKVGYGAFRGCTNLTSVHINADTIGSFAFSDCTKLTSLNLSTTGYKTRIIQTSAFWGCTALKSVNIPDGVKEIYPAAFGNQTANTSITVDSNNKYYSSLNGVLYNKDLTTLVQCPAGLSPGSLPQSLTTIEDYAFKNNIKCQNLTLPYGVTTIGYEAFRNMSSLQEIHIPSSVTYIGSYAFADLTVLTDFYINLNTPPTGITGQANSFGNIKSGATCHVPHYQVSSYSNNSVFKNAFRKFDGEAYDFYYYRYYYTVLSPGTYENDNGKFAGGTVKLVRGKNDPYSVGIPLAPISTATYNNKEYAVISIEPGAFTVPSWRSALKTVVAKNVVSISAGAFKECGALDYVDAPLLSSVGDSAFYNCKALRSASFPRLRTVGDYAFYNTKKLERAPFGNQLFSLGVSSFESCNFKYTVKIPENCKIIKERAFYNCSYLPRLDVYGTGKQIGDNFFGGEMDLSFRCYMPLSELSTYIYRAGNWPTVGSIVPKHHIYPYFKPASEWVTISSYSALKVGEDDSEGTYYVVEDFNPSTGVATTRQIDYGTNIRANAGLLVNVPKANTYYFLDYATATGATYSGPNLLKGTGTGVTITQDNAYTRYVFQPSSNEFQKVASLPKTYPEGYAYLELPATTAGSIDAISLDLFAPPSIKGDVNGDGVVNSSDVVAIYNYINEGVASGYTLEQTDVNKDGQVNSADAVEVYNVIVGEGTAAARAYKHAALLRLTEQE